VDLPQQNRRTNEMKGYEQRTPATGASQWFEDTDLLSSHE
jgi:hypothetical protein